MAQETFISERISSKPGTFIAIVLLYFIGVMHLLRLVFQVDVIAGGMVIPMWVSGIGFIASVVLASVILRENSVKRGPILEE